MIPRPRLHTTSRTAKRAAVIPTDYFGQRPDVDAALQMTEHPIPVGEVCTPCRTEITEADRGYLDLSKQTGELTPIHLECDVLLHLGWDVRRANCATLDLPPQATIRDLARAALDHVNFCRAKTGLGPL